jgi:ABC-2 type transport system ATP-binding protein
MEQGSGTLAVRGLSKVYGAKRVVDDVSFSCERGSVTGFVGPNGSGKSTTLRMIVGHARPTAGSAHFDGVPLPALPEPGRAVGVLLDASAHHPGRSVLETGILAAMLIGVGPARVRDCLDAVGIDSVRSKRVGTLSLGMRQRLGIALAVLGAPSFLVLDEPANGLDPEGIHWLRAFLRAFADGGGTALVSSHQLGELESASDAVIVIDRGRIRDVGSAASSGSACHVLSDDDSRLARILAEARMDSRPADDRPGLLVDAVPDVVFALAVANGLSLTRLAVESDTLESRFLRATSGEFTGLSGDRLIDVVRTGRS